MLHLTRRKVLHLMILLVIGCFIDNIPQRTEAVVSEVIDVLNVVKEVVTGVLRTWDIVEQTPLSQDMNLPFMRDKQKKVLKRLKDVTRHIDNSQEKHAMQISVAVQSVNDFIITNQYLMSKMNEITNTLNRINSRYKKMLQYEVYKDKLQEETLIDFSHWTVSSNGESIHYLMDHLHLTLFGSEEKDNSSSNVFQVLSNNYKEANAQICTTQQSPQQFVYSLYTDLALTELKGYIMMEFSWMILRLYGKGNFTQEADLMRQDYERRTEKTLKLVREVMRRADRVVWRCDPYMSVKGETYDEITRLLQGFIENEVDLNNDETCRETCTFYLNTRSGGCFKNKFCARQPKCNGRLYHCTFVDSDMWVCPATNNSTRRYEYIEYENGRILGRKNPCTRGKTKVDSWWRYLFWHCSYCFCLCDESGLKSDRFFNLREYVSDVENNKIVTGLRFVKVNRIFHLQIQEGNLLPRGAVNESSLSWKPVHDYKIFDRNVRNGRDFHTLNYLNRAIDLDEIHGDYEGFIVTGVRFRLLGTHLNLEVQLTEFDFESGTLLSNTLWQSNDNTDLSEDKRKRIDLVAPDIPTRMLVKSNQHSSNNQFIEFINTDMDKDAAQSTVPFVDIQDVISIPPVPLSGIGIYHKGNRGSGGFIAPKIITYDFSSHVSLPKSIK